MTTTAVAIGAAAELPTAVNPRTQLRPVAMGAVSPTIIGTKAPTKARNLAEFVREQKDVVTYASAGVGTAEHLPAAYVMKDFNTTHVPFRSGGEVMNAVIGNHVKLSVTPIGSAMAFIQDGQLQISWSGKPPARCGAQGCPDLRRGWPYRCRKPHLGGHLRTAGAAEYHRAADQCRGQPRAGAARIGRTALPRWGSSCARPRSRSSMR